MAYTNQMLTELDIKKVYGDDVILLFKGQEPFYEAEKDVPSGVLIQNSQGKVRCYLCENWFEQLHTHLRKHKISQKDYREKFGFNKSAPLCSEEYSAKMSNWFLDSPQKMEKQLSLMNDSKKGKVIGRPKGTFMRMQEKNRRNTCPEQVRHRMELLINRFGNNLSIKLVRQYDAGLVQIAHRNFNGWNEFKKTFGLTPDISSKKKDRAILLYDLRLFVSKNNCLPWKGEKDENKIRQEIRLLNFPHSKQPYIREFGSINKTKLICGIKKGHNNTYYLWN